MTNCWETEVRLSSCKYDKRMRTLFIALNDLPFKHGASGFPTRIIIHSEKTERRITFYPVRPNDRLYDEDQWDGEQQIYRPSVVLETVDCLVIVHHG